MVCELLICGAQQGLRGGIETSKYETARAMWVNSIQQESGR
jgi:hypothetical protein